MTREELDEAVEELRAIMATDPERWRLVIRLYRSNVSSEDYLRDSIKLAQLDAQRAKGVV